MAMSSSSEVLSPREFKRQVRRYLLISSLLWLFLSLGGFVWGFRSEISAGVSLPIFSEGRVALAVGTGMAFLAVLSILWGIVLALPTVGLLAATNSDSPFNARFESSGRRMRRAFLAFLQPVVFSFTHLFFLWLSLAAAPVEIRRTFPSWEPVHEWARNFFEIFYSEKSEDLGPLWRKAYGGNDSRALVVLLPASVLADVEYLPLLERELGVPVPFFVDSSTTEAMLRQLFASVEALGDKDLVPFPSPQRVWGGVSHARELQVILAPELLSVAQTTGAGAGQTLPRMSMERFIGLRLMQSQPHLFLLSRWGIPGWFLAGASWEDISAEDGWHLRRFLHDAVRSHRESRVRVIQFSENDGAASPFPRLAFRLSSQASSEERRRMTRDLDQILGRGLASIRNHSNVSIAVLPYPDFGRGTPLSHAFLKLPGEFAMPRGWLLARDLQPLLGRLLAGRLDPAAPSDAPSEMTCDGLRLAPGAASPNGSDARLQLWRGVLSYLAPRPSEVFHIPSEFSAFSADFHKFGVFCRNRGDVLGPPPDARLVLWEEGGEGVVQRGDTLGAALAGGVEAERVAAVVATRRGKRAGRPAPPTAAAAAGLQIEGRLSVHLVPWNEPNALMRTLGAAESHAFLTANAGEIRRGLEQVVRMAERE